MLVYLFFFYNFIEIGNFWHRYGRLPRYWDRFLQPLALEFDVRLPTRRLSRPVASQVRLHHRSESVRLEGKFVFKFTTIIEQRKVWSFMCQGSSGEGVAVVARRRGIHQRPNQEDLADRKQWNVARTLLPTGGQLSDIPYMSHCVHACYNLRFLF